MSSANENQPPAPKDYCDHCHISFGSAEKRYSLGTLSKLHRDCREKLVRQQVHLFMQIGMPEQASRIH